ncbi:retrovirus-related pol polyprotein from transposon TNT 1-94, partial [Tanacetum coccineum]
MGGLHASIEDAISSSLFRCLFIGSQDLHISHVLYADDTLFFGEWNDQNINNLITGLGCFYTVSGLPINFQKSNLFCLRIQQSEVERLASGKGCSASFLPFTYLRLPLGVNMKKEARTLDLAMEVVRPIHHSMSCLQDAQPESTRKTLAFSEAFDSLVDLSACTYACAPKLKEHSQLLRLMQFLMGLDDTYGPVKCLILTTDPLPDVKYAFATFSRDESHRQSHVNASTSRSGPSAFAAKHTIDRCYELVGYPLGFKKKGTSQSINNVNNVVPDKVDHSRGIPHTFTSDQYQRLMNLLSGPGESSNVQDNVTNTFGCHNVVLANTSPFAHPNGTVAQVMQIGNYKHFKNLIIKDVLVVPSYHDLTKSAKQTIEPFPLSEHKTTSLGGSYSTVAPRLEPGKFNKWKKLSLRSGSASLKDLEMQITQTLDLANIYGRKNNFSSQKANKDTECYKCGKKGHFARDCFSKTSEPSYKSPMSYSSSVSKGFQHKFSPKLIQSSQHAQSSQGEPKVQKYYNAEYKKMKAKLALLKACPPTSQSSKPFQSKNKGLVAKTLDWDEEEVSDDEEETRVQVLMALADDELSVGKNHVHNGE